MIDVTDDGNRLTERRSMAFIDTPDTTRLGKPGE